LDADDPPTADAKLEHLPVASRRLQLKMMIEIARRGLMALGRLNPSDPGQATGGREVLALTNLDDEVTDHSAIAAHGPKP
jgi:hypothetical protein